MTEMTYEFRHEAALLRIKADVADKVQQMMDCIESVNRSVDCPVCRCEECPAYREKIDMCFVVYVNQICEEFRREKDVKWT